MRRRLRFATYATALFFVLTATTAALAAVPPVPVPPENPITDAKRILGKLLFWEEQLSTDDTVACGTCHIPANGGADPRPAVHPGPDGDFGTEDDVFGSLGVVRLDEDGLPQNDPDFGFAPQVTGRAAQSYFGSMWSEDLFWDGRASETFRDPLTDAVLIPNDGGLESQAVGPILSSVEMAKEGRTWTEVVEKLDAIEPMRLATDLPPDMAAAVSGGATYGDLFSAAFGDAAITPARIAFAIATYERTLVPDQTPWDLFDEGDAGALTLQQQQGLQIFQNDDCGNCHTPPLFTNDNFHNIGLRPAAEDVGRQDVTGAPGDFGDFKTPSLRNIGLRTTLMHNGQIEDVPDAVNFYREGAGHVHFEEDQDNIPMGGGGYNFNFNPGERAALIAFLQDGLTDPRVAAEEFPFDRPTLRSEAGNPVFACAALPQAGCDEPSLPGQSPLLLKDLENDNSDLVAWRYRRGGETTNDDFGNPVTVDPAAFCLYSGAGAALVFEARIPAGELCREKPCWKKLKPGSSGDKGYVYKDADRSADGVLKVQLRPGEEGKTKIALKAKGPLLEGSSQGLPTPPIDLPVVAQLQSAAGRCFSVTYVAAAKNADGKFSAK